MAIAGAAGDLGRTEQSAWAHSKRIYAKTRADRRTSCASPIRSLLAIT
jgi:hypothetical protein